MRAVIVLGLCLIAAPALAQRAVTFEMDCDSVQALIASRGRAVLQTSPTTYDRYVADSRFCERDEFAEPAYAPTADADACHIGYRCRARSDRLFR